MTQKAIFVFVAVCVIVLVNHVAIVDAVNGDVLATIAMVVVIA